MWIVLALQFTSYESHFPTQTSPSHRSNPYEEIWEKNPTIELNFQISHNTLIVNRTTWKQCCIFGRWEPTADKCALSMDQCLLYLWYLRASIQQQRDKWSLAIILSSTHPYSRLPMGWTFCTVASSAEGSKLDPQTGIPHELHFVS